MKVSGFTIVRNGESFDYPYLESLRSLLPLVDELVINVGTGDDNTLEKIRELMRSEEAEGKVQYFESHWPMDDPEKTKGGLILSEQTNLALERCTGDWCFYLQADEVLHESDTARIRNALSRANANPEIEALLFHYCHFYGSYDVVQETRSAYRREIRAIRKSSGATSVGDAQSFRKPGGEKLRALHTGACIYHYGWVRTPEAMKEKTFFMDQLYHGKPDAVADETRTPHSGDNYRYKKFWGLKQFKGTHPRVMHERIRTKGWSWDLKRSPFEWTWRDTKKIALDLFENSTGKRLFEYRSYRLVSPEEQRTPSRPRPHAAVVITTYNDPRSLGLCLKSLSNQTTTDFEVFIADDGSSNDTKSKIQSLEPLFTKRGQRIHHVWHQDDGYRKARINNEVFRRIQDYPITICVDGDTIAHHRFVEDHLAVHQNHSELLFMGRRVDLGKEISQSLSEENVLRFNQGLGVPLLVSGLKGDSRNFARAIRVTNPLLQRIFKRDRVLDLLGSNFSVTTSLLHKVNGYDEEFQSYWGEDGDLFVRIRNTGARLIGLKSIAIQYHLDHPRLDPNTEFQKRYYELLQTKDYVVCKNGIRKL